MPARSVIWFFIGTKIGELRGKARCDPSETCVDPPFRYPAAPDGCDHGVERRAVVERAEEKVRAGFERADGRLAAADSLMHDRPDSALAILQALHPDSLATQGDHAYRDLLLTQARYKCYITATTDSAINRALHYYRHHSHEQEKLTRAYIYKGAVMEELGHPDSAMHYYKTAEATAAPDDYFNLAYTKMRIATMYTNNYAMDGQDIKNYEEALKLFYKAHSKFYVFSCLHNLGCLYRDHEPQKAKTLLLKALSMSKEEKDTARIIEGYHALIVLYFYQQQYEQALRLIKKAIQTSNKIQNPSFWTSVSNVYARMGLPDSAMHYLGFAQLHDSLDDSKSRIYYIESLSEIALARGDTVKYLNLELLEKHSSILLYLESRE